VCPHCGGADRITKVKANPSKRIRLGLWRCGDCKGQFTVKVGTVFEHGRIPLHKMLQATYLMTCSKKGISAHQLHRVLEITYKSAWFLAHRIREALREGDLAPFGQGGGAVEVDETYIGRKEGAGNPRGGHAHKMTVLGLVDRETGRSRLFHVEKPGGEIQTIVLKNLSREARLMTDEHVMYRRIGREFAEHSAVHHYNKEYVRGDITTNTVEGCFSIFKRGMKGIYQHLPRSICTGIWRNMSFATATVRRTASMTGTAVLRRFAACPASGSPMQDLVRPAEPRKSLPEQLWLEGI
jgi:transposase-like protein